MKHTVTRYEDDDGRTIADMTNVGTGLVEHLDEALPSSLDAGTPSSQAWGRPEHKRPISDELGSTEERLMVVLGTLKAALSLWLVYVVVFALLIAVLLKLWA